MLLGHRDYDGSREHDAIPSPGDEHCVAESYTFATHAAIQA